MTGFSEMTSGGTFWLMCPCGQQFGGNGEAVPAAREAATQHAKTCPVIVSGDWIQRWHLGTPKLVLGKVNAIS